MRRLGLGIYWQLSSTVKEAGEVSGWNEDCSNGGRKNEMTIESRSVSVDGGERQMSQTSFFSWCWDTKKKTAQLDSRNTRPWHFKMFQINGDANSKVRKKHVRERIRHSKNARNIRSDGRVSAVTLFSKE